jgi:predicted dehydrogenase
MTLAGVSLVVAGAGFRGLSYARRAVDGGQARVVAVAEPDPGRRARFAAEFGVPADRAFADWTQLVAAGRLADAAVIATQDQMHVDPTVAFARLGYHILLEKPMAPTEAGALAITAAVDEAKVIFAVCHVLRYTPYSRVLRRILDSGQLGRLVSVQHLEPVGWWHHAHSFVRGQWGNTATSAPMLLTKACHDIDWLLYLFGQEPRRVSSFGALTHFRAEDRPAGAADRCLDCPVESSCPYSARRLYLSCLGDRSTEFWPLSAVTDDHTPAGVLAALRTGPYGRCVYTSDNDVVDHQVVSMEFPDGATCSFTMTAFTPMEGRRTRLFGSHGYIEGDGRILRVVDFRTGAEETVDTHAGLDSSVVASHGGGDAALTDAFLTAVATGDRDGVHSDAATSLASHRVVWAAERARLTGTVVRLDDDPAYGATTPGPD